MKWRNTLLAFLVLVSAALTASFQSLTEAARQEAARRKKLDEAGIAGKVIEQKGASPLAVKENSSPASDSGGDPASRQESRSDRQLRTYRNKLQGLDRKIKQAEERLSALRSRLSAARWELPKAGRISGKSSASLPQDRIRAQITDLEARLSGWRRERLETYDEGKKAGFLPGELDGKGRMP